MPSVTFLGYKVLGMAGTGGAVWTPRCCAVVVGGEKTRDLYMVVTEVWFGYSWGIREEAPNATLQ